jgi:hypothetical protein
MKINLPMVFIILVYIYLAYNYLANLTSCKCVESKYVEKVKTAEGFMLSVILLWIFLKLMHRRNPIFSKLLSIILFLTYLYFCYYVFQMNKTTKENCPCAMKWQRWLVNIQYILLLFEIILVLISSLF